MPTRRRGVGATPVEVSIRISSVCEYRLAVRTVMHVSLSSMPPATCSRSERLPATEQLIVLMQTIDGSCMPHHPHTAKLHDSCNHVYKPLVNQLQAAYRFSNKTNETRLGDNGLKLSDLQIRCLK